MEQDRPQGAHGRREESQRGGVPGESFRHCFQLTTNVTTRFDSLWTFEVNLTYKQAWASQHQSAENALEKRDKLLADSYNRLENKMRLVGATGIEDRLQEGVPEVIARLREAGIVVWVLTGDKQETAINIAHSCKLFTSQMEVIQLNTSTILTMILIAACQVIKLNARSRDAAESALTLYLDQCHHSSIPSSRLILGIVVAVLFYIYLAAGARWWWTGRR